MKVTIALLNAILASGVLAHDVGAPPTESVGCVLVGHEWICAGPASTVALPASGLEATIMIPTLTTLAPTSTGALACAATTKPTDTATATSATEHHDDDDNGEGHSHTDSAGTGSLPPRPTQSVDCTPHGDHWHCGGPANTTSGKGGAEASSTPVPGGAVSHGTGMGAVAAVLGMMAAVGVV